MINDTKLVQGLNDAPITVEQLSQLGDGLIAYVKPDEAQKLFPQVAGIPSGMQLFALLSAEGAPILLTDSRDAAVANAWEHKLQTVSLH